MNRVKKITRVLVMAVLVCAMLTSLVFAAGDGSMWINNMESDGSTTSWIVTDGIVTDGLVELTYDSELLTYQSIEVNANVALYAVNAEEAGLVKISWVAADAAAPQEPQWLFQITFAGEGEVTLSGAVNGGADTEFAELDTAELEKAILEAEGLYQANYTSKSWEAFEEVLASAQETLNDPTADQSDVDAAVASLNDSMASLSLKILSNNAALTKAILKAEGLRESDYTAESWAELEDALAHAKSISKKLKNTQKAVDDATNALNEAIANLELKPAEPETPTQPSLPSIGGGLGKLLEGIRKAIRDLFRGWGI